LQLPEISHSAGATRRRPRLVGSAIAVASLLLVRPAYAIDYIVNDEASCEAFIAGIGAAGFWLGLCYVTSGALPEADRLFLEGSGSIRIQGPFTNAGQIAINSTDRGFYGAGNFRNEGTVHILASDTPENYGTIRNSGTFTTDVDFGNYGTFTKTPNEFPCGEAAAPTGVGAADALYVLRTAVGSAECLECICDTDASGSTTAGDALAVLRRAVGLPVSLRCPCCENPTTTTTTTTMEPGQIGE
jgi:hypothetical protein